MNRIAVAAALIWICFGARLTSQRLERQSGERPVPLIPFRELPSGVFGKSWKLVENVELPDRTIEQANAFDYVNRRYRREGKDLVLYVAFVRDGASHDLHHARACFAYHGLEEEKQTLLELRAKEIPGLPASVATKLRFNEIVWRVGTTGRAYSLSAFFFNSQFDPDPDHLRAADRFPGFSYYLSIVLVGDLTDTVEHTRAIHTEALKKLLPELLKHCPLTDPQKVGQPESTQGQRG